MRLLTFADAAREIGCKPRDISDLLYARQLDESKLIPIGNRKAIPAEYLPVVREVLGARGKIHQELATA